MTISPALHLRDRPAGPFRANTAALSEQAGRTALSGLLILLALIAPTLIAWGLDERQLSGVSVWDKPLKFELSISIHLATIFLLLPLAAPAARAGRAIRVSTLVATFAAIGEIGWILIQAARGRVSHFNSATPLETGMYALMGIGAVSMVFGAFILGVQILRRGRDDVGVGVRAGAAIGLILGAVATVIIAGLMSSGVYGPGHWVGGVRSDVSGLPITGWSTTGGDLRAPHFFATHAMQVLPAAGWIADRVWPSRAQGAVVAATFLWAALIVATFAQALMGLPLVWM